ncbi:unnamed protein product [Clonostachys chloroleuca]|uniref:Uncharacterized protein n=1 Tax=Clonostachys chloroleuca TaxID=1926264 RepID=A0AA35QDM5_9HYPO|nr:unnamed protein product [Clonostachys chloroleuca]
MPFLKSGRSRVLKTSHTDGIALCAEASSSASLSPDDELFTEGSPSRATPSRPASASRSAPASNLDHPPTIASQPQDANVTINGVASAALQNTSGDVSTDGRIRNPIPSKLLDSATEKDGNFAVMHMDVGKPVMDARSMAAKRTSELTQAAAMQANKNGYQPVKRSRLVWNTSSHDPQQHPNMKSYEPTPLHPLPQSLSPVAVKAEQARILTLLRSIHPVIVVDQLCKAIAYFGGIPGAPPPPNNVYPESDKRNGSGALFIGWLSEIFPPADFTKPPFAPPAPNPPADSYQPSPVTNAPSGEAHTADAGAHEDGHSQPQPPVAAKDRVTQQNPETPKRPRGRPKGSKSSKVRKDKGIKKGSRVSDASFANTNMSASNLSGNMESQGDSSQNPAPTQVPGDSNNDHHPMSSQLTGTSTQVPGGTSITETPGSGTPSVNGLSQHAENWAGSPIQDHSQPSEPSPQKADDQANKRKATAQAGGNDYLPLQTHGQGQSGESQQPQQMPESQAIQNKRPRLSQDPSESTIISPTDSINGRAPTLTAQASQDTTSSGSTLHIPANYDLSPTVGPMSVQSAQPRYQQSQVSQLQQQMQEQEPANVSFNRIATGPAQPFDSQPPQQGVRERSTQNEQAFYNQLQQGNQQRAQQNYQQLQNRNQFAQLKAASNISSHAGSASPGSSPTEIRRPNPPVPAAQMTASYPAAYSNDSAFMAMEYAMSTNRAVEQSQEAFASQPTPTQLEAALSDSDMRERLYQAFSGRR